MIKDKMCEYEIKQIYELNIRRLELRNQLRWIEQELEERNTWLDDDEQKELTKEIIKRITEALTCKRKKVATMPKKKSS